MTTTTDELAKVRFVYRRGMIRTPNGRLLSELLNRARSLLNEGGDINGGNIARVLSSLAYSGVNLDSLHDKVRASKAMGGRSGFWVFAPLSREDQETYILDRVRSLPGGKTSTDGLSPTTASGLFLDRASDVSLVPYRIVTPQQMTDFVDREEKASGFSTIKESQKNFVFISREDWLDLVEILSQVPPGLRDATFAQLDGVISAHTNRVGVGKTRCGGEVSHSFSAAASPATIPDATSSTAAATSLFGPTSPIGVGTAGGAPVVGPAKGSDPNEVCLEIDWRAEVLDSRVSGVDHTEVQVSRDENLRPSALRTGYGHLALRRGTLGPDDISASRNNPRDGRVAMLRLVCETGRERDGAPIPFETDSFLLQQVQEARREKVQFVETFGEEVGFFYGERPNLWSYRGALFNTEGYSRQPDGSLVPAEGLDWVSSMWDQYRKNLRGTKVVRNLTKVILLYDNMYREGYLVSIDKSVSVATRGYVQFGFTMWVTEERSLTGSAVPEYKCSADGSPVRKAVMPQEQDPSDCWRTKYEVTGYLDETNAGFYRESRYREALAESIRLDVPAATIEARILAEAFGEDCELVPSGRFVVDVSGFTDEYTRSVDDRILGLETTDAGDGEFRPGNDSGVYTYLFDSGQPVVEDLVKQEEISLANIATGGAGPFRLQVRRASGPLFRSYPPSLKAATVESLSEAAMLLSLPGNLDLESAGMSDPTKSNDISIRVTDDRGRAVVGNFRLSIKQESQESSVGEFSGIERETSVTFDLSRYGEIPLAGKFAWGFLLDLPVYESGSYFNVPQGDPIKSIDLDSFEGALFEFRPPELKTPANLIATAYVAGPQGVPPMSRHNSWALLSAAPSYRQPYIVLRLGIPGSGVWEPRYGQHTAWINLKAVLESGREAMSRQAFNITIVGGTP